MHCLTSCGSSRLTLIVKIDTVLLRQINITNFKNIASAKLEFSDKLNCFLGDNGMGKSNVLDAIYYLSFCRSFTGVNDSLIVRKGEDFTLLQASYLRHNAVEDINLSIGKNRRKSLKRSGKEYTRLSNHIGLFPAVLVSPADMDLVTGAGEVRRRFMDMVISQGNAEYLDALIKYNSALDNRNKLLRSDIRDTALFQAYETAMDRYGNIVTEGRRRFVDELSVIHQKYYNAITSGPEITELRFSSQMDGDPDGSLINILDHRRDRDRMLGFTSAGPHRDDLEMTLAGMPLRRTASQGQSKTYTIALRLAQYDFLAKTTGLKPLLLLDDIFDKLDSRRVENIIALVTDTHFGQIFITDTNRKHLDEIISNRADAQCLWTVTDGHFVHQ